MIPKKLLTLAIGLLVCSCALFAQSDLKGGNLGVSGFPDKSGLSRMGGMEKLSVPKTEGPSAIHYDSKNDTKNNFDELDKKMKERAWSSEESAWAMACEINTIESYERYTAIYPNGRHIAEAYSRFVEAKIAETLANAHNDLPEIKHTDSDDDSPSSTVVVKNNTGLPLTVYYSGAEAKRITIAPGATRSVTLENGSYKLMASVPPAYIMPYAGKTELEGGRYEIGFWIVNNY